MIRIVITAALLATLCLAQTGAPIPAFASVDTVMQQALSRYSVKGGAVAVVKDGHLVFARGYGWADAETLQPTQPDSLFRWASISKTLTATAVMRLVDDGKLDLDTPVFSILNQYSSYNGKLGDSRLSSITVRQVLHHVGGWDRSVSGDPMSGTRMIDASNATKTGFPPSRDGVIQYMLSQRLDFEPGSRFAYSNFGYILLGRVIEKITGVPYETYVRDSILALMGLTRIQQGGSTLAGRLPGEVKYYDYPGAPLLNSYLSPARELQPGPYGYSDLSLNDADGGWVGSAIDLAKFTAGLDGTRAPAPLSAGSFAAMIAQTPRSTWVDSVGWYGFGLFATPQLGGITWDHGGSLIGTRTGFWRYANGLCYAFLFNGDSKDQVSLNSYVSQALWEALAPVTEWPDRDLFPEYYPPHIASAGVVNAASFRAGPVAPGSLFTILGSDLGAANASIRNLPVELLFTSPGQVNAVVPEAALPGDATLTVQRAGWPEVSAPVVIAPVSPGLFTQNQAGLVAASVVRSRPGGQ